MDGPEGGKKKPKTPNAGLVAPTNNRRRTGDLVGTKGIEPNRQPLYILWQEIYSLPLVPDEPLEPDLPDEPLEPELPDEPDEPLEPDVPEEPLEPDVPELPEEPLVPLLPLDRIF